MLDQKVVADEAAHPHIPDLWQDTATVGLNEQQLLSYRSNLLGSDKRITNYGGGNTSAKIAMRDPLGGHDVEVLWVKGSGGDLGSIGLDGFATLYMEKLQQLKSLFRGREFEDEMVGILPQCTFDLNPRAASIDTPLHAYIPHRHVDHMHPDAVIAIAAAKNSRSLTDAIFDGEIGWLPWQRPGFDLGLKLEEMTSKDGRLVGIVLAGHGLFTWADTSKECYSTTLRIIRRATAWLDENTRRPAFGGPKTDCRRAQERRAIAAKMMPIIRGRVGSDERKIGHFVDDPAVLEFVNSVELASLAELGTSCPDHFLRTKIRPIVLNADFGTLPGKEWAQHLDHALSRYRQDYAAYYRRHARPDSPAMRDPNPVVFLLPGIGMMTFARNKATARIASEYYVNAINVMRGASGVDSYVGLRELEAFNIEYWELEDAKLRRLPKPRSLEGRVALITGGAGGIGKAVARKLLAEGACVGLVDVDGESLHSAEQDLAAMFGADHVCPIVGDVTQETSVIEAIEAAVIAFGGIDILVSNAGIASAAPIEETTLEMWQKNFDILSTGYFLFSRETMAVLRQQSLGGSIVFVASKNALVASPFASAYCAAKASEIQLARVLALEGAPQGIRANIVNPDAVLRDSKIWSGRWREDRAQAYNIDEQDLEEYYRQRSLLKQTVEPADVAEAVYFFASDLSAKSTGNILNVDAGNSGAFTR